VRRAGQAAAPPYSRLASVLDIPPIYMTSAGDVDGVRANHAFPGCKIPVLFSASYVEIECIGDELVPASFQ